MKRSVLTIVAFATLLLLAVLSMPGCDQWYTVELDPDMQHELGLATTTVTSDRYPALRLRYDAIKREKADAVAAQAARDAKAEADAAAKTARQESEVVSKANRELAAKVADLKRRHDNAVREADAELDAALASAGATAAEIVGGAQYRAEAANLEAQNRIAGLLATAATSQKAIDGTRLAALKLGDTSYEAAKQQQADTLVYGQQAVGIVAPLLGGGAVASGATALIMSLLRRGDKQKIATQASDLTAAAGELYDTRKNLDATGSALDAVTHGLQLAKGGDEQLPQDVKTVADAVRVITKRYIAAQATKADEVVIEQSAAGAGVT